MQWTNIAVGATEESGEGHDNSQ